MSLTTVHALSIAIQVGHTPYLEGPPGLGKTSMVGWIADALSRNLRTLIANIHEPSDFNGWPQGVQRPDGLWMMRFMPVDWVVDCLDDPRMIVLLDELPAAPPAVQNALLRVINERWVGQTRIPDTVSFVAAGNSIEQTAGGWDLGAPIASRMTHLTWKPDADYWIRGMSSGWARPDLPILKPDWKTQPGWYETKALVLGYLSIRRQHFYQEPEPGQRPFPTGRTWDHVIDLVGACRTLGMKYDDPVPSELAAGTVGIGVSGDFMVWARQQDLPDPEDVLKNPGKYDYGAMAGDKLFAVLQSVAGAIESDLTYDRWCAGFDVLTAVMKTKKDVATNGARAIIALRPKLPAPIRPIPTAALSFAPLLVAAGVIPHRN